MNYRLEIKRRAQKEIGDLPPKIRQQVLRKILALEEQPWPHDSIALKGEKDAFRVDSGNYRVLYHSDSQSKQLTVFRVKHRKDVYRGL